MKCILFLIILLASCSSTNRLPAGEWSGYFSPMNQSDKRTTLKYGVTHGEEYDSLQIFGPRGMNMETRDLMITQDTLFFSFDKMDQTGSLSCALKKVNKSYYYGRCTDQEGRWAIFTMQHNSLLYTRGPHQGGGCLCHTVDDTGN